MTDGATRKLMRIDPAQAAKIAGLLYFAIGIIIGAIMVVTGLFAPSGGLSLVALGVVAPAIYAAMGALTALIATSLFNWAAKRTGGLSITVALDAPVPTTIAN